MEHTSRGCHDIALLAAACAMTEVMHAVRLAVRGRIQAGWSYSERADSFVRSTRSLK